MMGEKLAGRVKSLPDSVIREMTKLAEKYDAVNLAQGFPDLEPPAEVKEAAKKAIDMGYNQYARTWGTGELCEAIAKRCKDFNGIEVDPEKEVVVTCGSTEAMMSSILAVVDKDDEVIIFEPFYENYWPDTVIAGGKPVFIELKQPTFKVDEEELKRVFSRKVKAVIINNPNNPSGKVFSQQDLKLIRDLCLDYDALVISDEVYDNLIYDGAKHVSIASLPGMYERSLTINSISKTYNATGWRVGWVVGCSELIDAVKKVHDFMTVGAAHPLQKAAEKALSLPRSYYNWLVSEYSRRRDIMLKILDEAGFRYYKPDAAYYVLADITGYGFDDDFKFSEYLVREVGVAVVPGSSFYYGGKGSNLVRFQFARHVDTLLEAGRRLTKLRKLRQP